MTVDHRKPLAYDRSSIRAGRVELREEVIAKEEKYSSQENKIAVFGASIITARTGYETRGVDGTSTVIEVT